MQDVKTEFVEPADLPEKTQKEGVPAESLTKESVPAGVPADVPAESSTKESVPAGAVETSTKESVPAGAVETETKESAPAGAVETETKESAPAGVKVETSTKESVPASVKVETETKESVPPGKAETETKESVPPGKVETDTAVEPRVTPKPKPNREEETEEERKAREAHNSYMRCFRSLRSVNCPPEVREKAFTKDGKKRSSSIMRHMYEMWISSGCDWLQSSIVLNAKKRNNTRRTGRYVWKRFDLLKTEHGEAIAEDIRASKKGMDPDGRGRWWKVHPDQPKNEDWELFKCFDSREEVTESESETEFQMNADVGLDHAGTTGAFNDPGSNDLPPPPPPKLPRKEKKAKPAPEEALDLLKKGTQRIIEADGMEAMLKNGGMHLGLDLPELRGDAFAKAMVSDMRSDIDLLKQRHTELQHAVTTKEADSEIGTLNMLLKASYSMYDEKMKAVKRAIRPAPKAKANPKGKAHAKAKAAA
ncbi:unnamed protein product [Symbiodinium sp. CCMP2592]|nr:unnamed protein product [Symbiodinium sp. CCMP2592]